MDNQNFDDIHREGETHERDHEDSDQYSSSESCSNTTIAVPKLRKTKNSAASGSWRAKRKAKVPSSMRSDSEIAGENRGVNTSMQQKFRELFSIIPGLDMKDEDLMLDDTISYMKELQDHANILEQQNKNIHVEKAWVFGDNDIGESSSASIYQSKQGLPEIKAKAQGKDVLIKVHCENKKGFLPKLLKEVEKLHLNVGNITSLPFGDYFLDITVTAQRSDEFCMYMKDLERKLSEALLQLTM